MLLPERDAKASTTFLGGFAKLVEVYETIAGHCNACRHYDSEPFGEVNYGQCRYFPPLNFKKHEDGLPRGVWPIVGYDDFCGKYEPK